jgi:hypothetical protein
MMPIYIPLVNGGNELSDADMPMRWFIVYMVLHQSVSLEKRSDELGYGAY